MARREHVEIQELEVECREDGWRQVNVAVFPLFLLYLGFFFKTNGCETIVVFNCLFRDNGVSMGASY